MQVQKSLHEVTYVPFDLGGKVYRGAMPSSDLAAKMQEFGNPHKITHIFMLISQAELETAKNGNLKLLYEKNGYKVEHYPIADLGTPALPDMKELVYKIIAVAQAGNNVLIHCKAGKGRTGLVLSCLAMERFHMTYAASTQFIEAFLGHMQHSPKQKVFLSTYKSDPIVVPQEKKK